ncbi:MAG: hypothetical protein IJ593_07790 [Lachnospiraceae bacterium]|nr:hypothetical protein [Lachnospiraceae bacterium]
MAELNIQSMVGTKIHIADFGTAGTQNANYIELPGIEETTGGGIVNNTIDYTPHDTGVTSRAPGTQSYNNVVINVAKDVKNTAFGDPVVTVLNDLTKNRTKKDLVKAVPTGGSQYEVTVWSGVFIESTVDEANANNLQRGSFTFAPSARKEFIGTYTDGNLTLTARR